MNGIDRSSASSRPPCPTWLGAARPDYLTDILGRTAVTRQRPAWASLERWLPMELATPRATAARVPWRFVAVAGRAHPPRFPLALYAGSQRRMPPPFGPAANGVIPFDRGGDIFVGDPVGGGSFLVVGGPENDYGPTFSPDGTMIGFVREASRGEHIYVVNADGRTCARSRRRHSSAHQRDLDAR